MYDIEKITKIIADLERYFNDLEKLGIKEMGDLEDRKNFYSVSMVLFAILNRAIDLGGGNSALKKFGNTSDL